VKRMAGGVKAKTLWEYEKEMKKFQDWRGRWNLGGSLPAPQWQVMAYLEWVCQVRGPGVGCKVLASIEKVHRLRLRPLPKSKVLQELSRAMEKASKRNRDPEKVSDLPVVAVLAWAQKLRRLGRGAESGDQQGLVGLALGLRAIKRAADLAQVRIRDVSQCVEGGILVFFPDTKNHPEGELVPIEPAIGVPVCPSTLVWEWAQERKAQGARPDDWLFVKPRGGMTDSAYWTRIVRAAVEEAQRIGWLPKGGKWSSRSMRSGGASRMQALGYGEAAIMALGGWLSKAMQYYLRKTHLSVEKLSTRMFQI
jgi:hypothetical protein